MTRTTSTEKPMEPAGFDTLAWSEMLRSSGISKKQAEMQVRVIAQAVQNGAATKSDLLEVENRLDKRIDMVAAGLDKKIDAAQATLRNEIGQGKIEVLRWMFTLFIAQIGIIAALLKFMN